MNVVGHGILYSFRLRTILVAALYYIRYASVHRKGRPVCLPRYMPHDHSGIPLWVPKCLIPHISGQPQGIAPTVDVFRFFALLKMTKYT